MPISSIDFEFQRDVSQTKLLRFQQKKLVSSTLKIYTSNCLPEEGTTGRDK